MCEYCPRNGDESRCFSCRRDTLDAAENWDAPKKRYSATVAAVCLTVLVLIVVVAAVCGVVNQLTTR